jgi:nucleotide-binding universal stress UspA family protein
MYKNILVPVVLSDDHVPTEAFEIVKHLAADGAQVTLLHVIEELPGYATVYLAGELIEESRKAVTDKLSEIAKSVEGARPVVVNGHSARTILSYAEENGCDCIVVSSHKPGVQDYFLGGTAARVVRYAKCAVHVIR